MLKKTQIISCKTRCLFQAITAACFLQSGRESTSFLVRVLPGSFGPTKDGLWLCVVGQTAVQGLLNGQHNGTTRLYRQDAWRMAQTGDR
ncbi:hypothetical protein XB02_06650 [Pantoea ananatis]|nr:hypothetical protein XB02_06650 [Pantoea ananatis]